MKDINCAILAIGSELLEGSVIDTNSGFIGGKLLQKGFKVNTVCLVPDNKEFLIETINRLSLQYHLIFTTGGLGPTFDDITSECIANCGNVSLEVNNIALNHIKNRLNSINVPIRDSHIRQANLPQGCYLFKNSVGTAYGFGLKVNKSFIISMPGVPAEMTVMFDEEVLPYLESNYNTQNINRIEIHFGLTPESEIDNYIKEINIPDNTECIINAGKSEIAVKIKSKDKDEAFTFAKKIADKFSDNFMGFNIHSPAEALINILKEKNKTISVAESCTGGYIGKSITDFSGVSDVFLGGIISYSNNVKIKLLNVKKDTLKNFGAVSSNTAEEMAIGAINVTNSDYAISITGVAGPTGGSKNKPVGTVFIGISNGNITKSYKFNFNGKRDNIRYRSVNASLFLAYKFIRDN